MLHCDNPFLLDVTNAAGLFPNNNVMILDDTSVPSRQRNRADIRNEYVTQTWGIHPHEDDFMSNDKFKLACSNGLRDGSRDSTNELAPYTDISPPAPDSAGIHPQRLTCKKTLNQDGMPTGRTAWEYQGQRVKRPESHFFTSSRVGPHCQRPECLQTYNTLNESLHLRGFELDSTEIEFSGLTKYPKSKEILYDYDLNTGTSVREGEILDANDIRVRCINKPEITSSIECKYMNPNLIYDQSIEQLDSSICIEQTGGGRSGGGRRSGGGSRVSVHHDTCGAYFTFNV